jgi:rhodanese-related sulfurtransferase
MSETQEIDIEQFARARATGTLVDVRERHEYAAGHVAGALLIPMAQVANRMDELDQSRPVYVICATGNRSRATTDLLCGSGFDAWSVAGGTAAWAASGRPVEGGPR